MRMKRFTAILFAFCIIAAMMPLSVFADDEPDRGWGDSLYVLGI